MRSPPDPSPKNSSLRSNFSTLPQGEGSILLEPVKLQNSYPINWMMGA
jgi:hypothetical protein